MSTEVVSLNWWVMAPVLAPSFGAVLVLVADAVAPGLRRPHAPVGVASLVVGLVAALARVGDQPGHPTRTLCLPAPDHACLFVVDRVAIALQVGALLSALVVLLLMWPLDDREARRDETRGGPAVVVSLVLAATAGAAGVAAAYDAASWLVCIELATLPVIALVALRGTRTAGRGALALLTTSLVSFALMVLGVALWVAATGQAVFASDSAVAALADQERRPILVLAVLFLLAGLGFKLSLAPFHIWTPQAYAGGTTPVATFLAGTSKVAALAALLVVLRPLLEARGPVLVAVGVLAVVSMTVGNIVALTQEDPVRLLAWSTVAQAGWVVLPLAAAQARSAPAAGGYLLAYLVATLVAFTVVHLVGSRTLSAYTGLLRRNPLVGAALALALLSLAGLPPGIVGLLAKVVALRPVVGQGQWVLALAAVANAVLGIAVYLRWFAALVRDPAETPEAPASSDPAEHDARHARQGRLSLRDVPRTSLAALGIGAVALVATSVMPQLLLGLVG